MLGENGPSRLHDSRGSAGFPPRTRHIPGLQISRIPLTPSPFANSTPAILIRDCEKYIAGLHVASVDCFRIQRICQFRRNSGPRRFRLAILQLT